MKTQEKEQLKEWWAHCPSKKIVYVMNTLGVIISFYCIYELGYAVGKVLANIGL